MKIKRQSPQRLRSSLCQGPAARLWIQEFESSLGSHSLCCSCDSCAPFTGTTLSSPLRNISTRTVTPADFAARKARATSRCVNRKTPRLPAIDCSKKYFRLQISHRMTKCGCGTLMWIRNMLRIDNAALCVVNFSHVCLLFGFDFFGLALCTSTAAARPPRSAFPEAR